jgi:hypothetical protein
MKRYNSALVGTVLIALAFAFQLSVEAQTDEVLTNASVIKMVKDGVAIEVMIAKIKASITHFDTSTNGLKELAQAQVPDAVAVAMVGHASGEREREALPASQSDVQVPDGQEVEIELTADISSRNVKVGDLIYFTVTQEVVVNGAIVIEKGATARALITTAKKNSYWGHAGKLEWAMKDVLAADRTRIPTRFSKRAVGDSKGLSVGVTAVALGILFPPVGLLAGLKKGEPAIIGAGNRYVVFISGNAVVRVRSM